MDLETRIIELETRSAYQERMIEELSEVLARQMRELERLHATIEHLRQLLRQQGIDDQELMRPEDEPPPPHY